MAILPYWIEEKLNKTYSVWTKVSVPAGGTKKIYVIHQEGYTPNGDAVFEFFDDFNGDSLDTTKWKVEQGVAPKPQNGYLTWNGACFVVSQKEFPTPAKANLAFEALWVDVANIAYQMFGTWRLTKDCDQKEWHDGRIYTGNGSTWTCTYKDGNCGYHYTYSPQLQDGIVQIHYLQKKAYLSVNGQYGWNGVETRAIATGAELGIYLRNDYRQPNQNNRIDWIRVRKLTASEVNITYKQIDGKTYEVSIENRGPEDLVDFQIELDGAQIGGITSRTDSLLITDTLARILFADELGEVYTIQNNQLVKVADSIEVLTEEIINEYGIISVANVSKRLLSQLGTAVKVLVYSQTSQNPKVVVKIDPYPQVVATRDPITLTKECEIDYVEILTSGDGEIRLLVSPDGETWYNFDDRSWYKVGKKTLEEIVKDTDFVWANGVPSTRIERNPLTKWIEDVKSEKMYLAIAFDGNINIDGVRQQVQCMEKNILDKESEIETLPFAVKVKFLKKGKYLVVVI